MGRLIDADALMKDLEKWLKQVDPTHPQEDNAIPPMENIIVSTLMTIEEQPTIEERKTGAWIDYAEDGYVECPFCHSATNCDGNIEELHFCFSCGAKMEGEERG